MIIQLTGAQFGNKKDILVREEIKLNRKNVCLISSHLQFFLAQHLVEFGFGLLKFTHSDCVALLINSQISELCHPQNTLFMNLLILIELNNIC